MIDGLKAYPAMSDSGVPWLGQVPEHWKVCRIKTLFREKDERSRDGSGLLLSLTRARGLLPQSAASNRLASAEDLSKYKVSKPGDLVMNRMQAWSGMFAVSSYEGLVSPDYSVFAAIERIEVKYFEHLFKTPAVIDEFAKASKGIGSGFNRLYTPDFGAVSVPTPPLSEQATIVRFLDHTDRRIRRYIRAKQKLIKLLEEQKQVVIHRAVARGLGPNVRLKPSGVKWLVDVPEHWKVLRLKWVTRLQRGYDLPADQRTPGPFPVVSSGGIIDTHCEARSKGPGVVIGRYGSTDAVFFVETDFWPHNTALFVTDFQGNRPRWCYFMLRTISKADHSGKSAVPGVDRKDLFEIKVALPPVTEQDEIVDGIEKETARIEGAVGAARHEITLIRDYHTRLTANVVTGKLDVREAAARLPDEVEEAEALEEDQLGGETEEVVGELEEAGAEKAN